MDSVLSVQLTSALPFILLSEMGAGETVVGSVRALTHSMTPGSIHSPCNYDDSADELSGFVDGAHTTRILGQSSQPIIKHPEIVEPGSNVSFSLTDSLGSAPFSVEVFGERREFDVSERGVSWVTRAGSTGVYEVRLSYEDTVLQSYLAVIDRIESVEIHCPQHVILDRLVHSS